MSSKRTSGPQTQAAQPLREGSSEGGADDKEALKRQYRSYIGRTEVEAPEVTGREVAGWVKDGHRFGKIQGGIGDVKVMTGTKQDLH